jgi:GNAT superfamily N-acetyltransferase
MEVRLAEAGDAEQACSVLRRSIRELCIEDHRNDEASLRGWLANKTPAQVLAWINSPGGHVLVASEGEAIAGVASAAANGEILLNYVSPDFRFRGVSKALVSALETYLRTQGCRRAFLSSTQTAHAFYRGMGYRDAGPSEAWRTMKAQPMEKPLAE